MYCFWFALDHNIVWITKRSIKEDDSEYKELRNALPFSILYKNSPSQGTLRQVMNLSTAQPWQRPL